MKGVEAKAARGAQLLEKQKKEEAKQPSCNSRWSQESGGEVYLFLMSLNAVPDVVFSISVPLLSFEDPTFGHCMRILAGILILIDIYLRP